MQNLIQAYFFVQSKEKQSKIGNKTIDNKMFGLQNLYRKKKKSVSAVMSTEIKV